MGVPKHTLWAFGNLGFSEEQLGKRHVEAHSIHTENEPFPELPKVYQTTSVKTEEHLINPGRPAMSAAAYRH